MSEPRRILVLSASAGAGHLRAAEAVVAAIALEAPRAQVRHVDVLSLASPAFRDAYSKWYLALVSRAPALWGYLYDRLDRPPKRGHPLDLRRALDHWETRRLVRVVKAMAPDVVICTHFLPAAALAEERRRRRLAVPLGVVITDADVHRMWLQQGVSRYFVAREEAAAVLERAGFAPEQVEVSGIPIDPRFGEPFDRAALRRERGLPDGAVVLLLAGGFGVGPVRELAARLEEARAPQAFVVVAGRNEALRRKLESAAGPRTRVLGFSSEIHDWMGAADILVTKPGGLTTAEALARGLPMLLVNPIPGQEQRNADALLEAGAALRAANLEVLGWKLDRLLADPARLASLREGAARSARPDAARRVASWALAVT